jgi:hypothetical protein
LEYRDECFDILRGSWAVCVLVPLFLILTLLPISPILKLY